MCQKRWFISCAKLDRLYVCLQALVVDANNKKALFREGEGGSYPRKRVDRLHLAQHKLGLGKSLLRSSMEANSSRQPRGSSSGQAIAGRLEQAISRCVELRLAVKAQKDPMHRRCSDGPVEAIGAGRKGARQEVQL
jgi:hypothetical protein